MTHDRTKILIVGGGGHSLTVLDIIRNAEQFEVAGCVDNDAHPLICESGVERLGGDADLPNLIALHPCVHIGIGQIKSPAPRQILYEKLVSLEAKFPPIISKNAYVSLSAHLGQGVMVSHLAVINFDAVIGNNCIVNTGAIIEHGASIGDHCHIAPGAIILGGVKIGDGTFIGAGAVVRESVQIGENKIIGAGESVMKDVL